MMGPKDLHMEKEGRKEGREEGRVRKRNLTLNSQHTEKIISRWIADLNVKDKK